METLEETEEILDNDVTPPLQFQYFVHFWISVSRNHSIWMICCHRSESSASINGCWSLEYVYQLAYHVDSAHSISFS